MTFASRVSARLPDKAVVIEPTPLNQVLRRTLPPRYLNSALFLPRDQIPSSAGAGAPAGRVRT